MENEYLQLLTLANQNIFEKIFKKIPRRNAWRELNNLVVTRNIREIKEIDISTLDSKYGTILRERYKKELRNLFLQYSSQLLSTPENITTKKNDIDYFGELLKIQPDKVDKDIHQIYLDLISSVIENAISDNKLDEKDEDLINKVAKTLDITDEEIMNIRQSKSEHITNDIVTKILQDGLISPEEDQLLADIQHNLSVKINMTDEQKVFLDKCRLMWKIQNADLPSIQTGLLLPKKEICYYQTDVEWLENRKVVRRVNYSGGTMRIKIAKGVYYRLGSISPSVSSEDVLTKIDEGTVFITNKRIIFQGSLKNINLPFNRIIDYDLYSDGILIQKDSGKNPVLKLDTDSQIFAAYLARAISDTQ